MKNVLFIFCSLLFVVSFAQNNVEQKANYYGTVSSVEYVSSLESRRNDLIPSDNSIKIAKDKRSLGNQLIIGKDPQNLNDYFVRNRHQKEQSTKNKAASLVFDAYASGSQPTDPSLAIGPNHVMVVFNTGFTIYDKFGTQLLGQTAPNPAIFPSGGCCDLTVSYDNAADRWVLTFLGSGAQVAISDGPNPLTAGWYVYNIAAINDYQKLSIWSDGYYLTDNTSSSNKVWALERDAMLVGDPSAQILGFNLPGISTSGFYSPQAFNVTNGNLPAPGGAPIVYLQDNAWAGVSVDHVKLWTVDVNWTTPGNSTISAAQEINTTPFISVFDNGSFSNLAQPGGGSSVDALQATIMNQAQFRKFGTHNSAVFNFVVDTDSGSGELAGIRWFEFRQSGDNQPWSLYQEGTYTAPNGRHAWNASLAMDGQGNIGMGYTSMSGPSTPSTVRISSYFTGRQSTDPLNTMTMTEELIANGNANFTGTRYGDYSKIDIDPSNDQTFWFITEYMNSGRKGVVGAFQIQAGPPDTQAPTDPTNLIASNITGNGATLNWTASTDNVGVVQYNISIDGNVVGTSFNTTYNVTGLSPLTSYDASVTAQDAAGNVSGSATTNFTTIEASINYCTSASTNINDEYIGRVQLNTIDNASGGQFYTDFTSVSTTLTQGTQYTITVTPTWTGTIYPEAYAVWIDYNKDGDFTDSGELVWSQSATTATPVSGNFTVPGTTVQDATRMRVSMKYNGVPTSCETFTYGEVEDYTIILQGTGPDTTPPVIILNGASTINLEQGNSYSEQGATATDNVDGDISANIVIGGDTVNTNVVGTYIVTYNVSDSAGNAATEVTRTVNVTPDVTPPVITLIGAATINLNVGDTYSEQGATASDSFDGDITANIVIGGDTVDTNIAGTYVVTYNVSDAAGNAAAQKTRTVDVSELSTGCSGGISSYPYSESFENTLGAWTQSSADDIDWTVDANGTPSSNTGPSSASTGTYYIYVEASSPNYPSKRAILNSPCFDLSGLTTPSFDFDYHMYGSADMGTIDLEASTDEGVSWTSIWNESGNKGNAWQSASIDLSAYAGASVQLRFNRLVGGTWQADIAIDNIRLSEPAAPTCSDGIQNGDETGIDCGGSVCAPCSTSDVVLHQGFFETGWDGWIDGGSDAFRYSGSNSYEGSYSIRLRDNTSSSVMTLPNIDVTPFAQIEVEFFFYPNSMENGEDFWLQYFNGSTYTTVASYAAGTSFNNGSFYTAVVTIDAAQFNFVSNAGFRFRCDASGNNDQIYIDQVTITGLSGGTLSADYVTLVDPQPDNGKDLKEFAMDANNNIKLYPNPVNSELTIEILEGTYDEVMIISSLGQLIESIENGEGKLKIDVSKLASGMYFVRFVSDGLATTKRFIKE